MKVALSFPGCHRSGGVERIVFECAHFLAQRNHRVEVFAREWETDPTQTIRYHPVPTPNRPYFMKPRYYFEACTNALKTAEYDVLNTHGCVCPLGGVHWVQSVHRAWLERSRQFRSAYSLSRVRQKLNPLHPVLLQLEARHFRDQNYQKVIATTPQVRDDLHRLYGVPTEDVVIIPNGFSPEEFTPERRLSRRAVERANLELRPNDIALLFVANELERKGYTTILEAMQRLNCSDLRLLVVGRANAEAARRQAQKAGLEAQVLVCGPTADVAAYHAAADIFVLPTQYEAFCLAILEALGSGLPVVTTCIPGAQDAIQPGINGSLIQDPKNGLQLAEALQPFLEKHTRECIASQAADTVRCYQWPQVLLRYEKVLMDHAGKSVS